MHLHATQTEINRMNVVTAEFLLLQVKEREASTLETVNSIQHTTTALHKVSTHWYYFWDGVKNVWLWQRVPFKHKYPQ